MKKVGDIICTYRKKNGLSQAELSNILIAHGYKASNKAVSSWERNTTEPSASLMLFLCKLLKINDIYSECYGSNPVDPFSELNAEGKEKALDYIELLVESGRYKKATILPFLRKIRLFDMPASAGVGNFLDGDDYTEIEVDETVPATADFAIRISGDSMEPKFTDGQIVYVQKQETLSNGEIGIFFLDGCAYCKKLDETEKALHLLSLNKAYDPIQVKENQTFKVFGKVVE